MSTDPPYTDEILSAIIDGEADAETVASVQADPEASARLDQMRRAVELVAEPAPEATPERRSASIAAAMAAATPQTPEVTSLAAARHERATPQSSSPGNRQWLALVAAAVALVVAIPLVLQFREANDDETATADTAADTTTDDASDDSTSLDAGADASSDGAGESADSMDSDDAMEEAPAMEEEAMAEGDDAMEQDDSADDAAADEPAEADEPADEPADEDPVPLAAVERLVTAPAANSLENIDQLISVGSIAPQLTVDQLVEVEVSLDCVETLRAELPIELLDGPIFDIAFLTEEGVAPRLVVVRFDEDGGTTTLDAEDCAQLG